MLFFIKYFIICLGYLRLDSYLLEGVLQTIANIISALRPQSMCTIMNKYPKSDDVEQLKNL